MDLLLESNPRRRFMFNPRRRHYRRNPTNPISALSKPLESITGGLPIMEIVAGASGLAAVTIVPNMVVKDSSKITGKLFKLAVGIGTALGVSYLAKSLGSNAQKAALIGGFAGVTVVGINMLRPGTIGEGNLLGPGIREGAFVSHGGARSEENVGVILP